MFLLLAPTLVAFIAALTWIAETGTKSLFIAEFCAAVLFTYTLPVAALSGSVDGCLARALPIALRAPLTAIVGAASTVGLLRALFRMMPPQDILMPFAIAGALCMGACSLLAHDYRS